MKEPFLGYQTIQRLISVTGIQANQVTVDPEVHKIVYSCGSRLILIGMTTGAIRKKKSFVKKRKKGELL